MSNQLQIYINDALCTIDPGTTLAQTRERFYPEAASAILNTVANPAPDTILRDEDRLYLYKNRDGFTGENLADLILARQPRKATEKLRSACVGIAGAGGLGSVVAENLARAGVGRLVIADFDSIEPTNLNRQRFQLRQLGLPKAAALADNLRGCCPFVNITVAQERITADNCVRVFNTCAIVCECFDAAESKASLVTELRRQIPDCTVVSASGLAGSGSARSITIRRVSDNLYIVGDMKSDVDSGMGLFAPRVGIVASLQAHVAMQLILGRTDMTLIINGEKRTFKQPLETVALLLEQLAVPVERTAVELNGAPVAQSEITTTALQDADRIEIVSFVGGG